MSKTVAKQRLCGCGRSKEVRLADVKRGWGKYYSKSCKARHQAKKIKHRKKRDYYEDSFTLTAEDMGYVQDSY